jgi:hypothetical protein
LISEFELVLIGEDFGGQCQSTHPETR